MENKREKKKKVKKISLYPQANPKGHANLKIMHRMGENGRVCMTNLKINYKRGGERGKEGMRLKGERKTKETDPKTRKNRYVNK